MSVTLDLMEYADDATAQAAYVSSDVDVEAEIITQDVVTEYANIGDLGNTEYRQAQSFLLSNSQEITKVSILFGATSGSPSGNVTFRIETDSSGVPSGTLAHANATKVITPTASQWNDVTFASSFVLAAGTYWIVSVCDTQDTGIYWTWGSTGNEYADGKRAASSDAGSSWAGISADDMTFKVYGLVDNLQAYSESTIKQQGTYSLKASAVITDSLNDTLTRTI